MGDYDDETCNTRLQLGLAFGADSRREMTSMTTTSDERSRVCLDLPFTLLTKPDKIANSDHHHHHQIVNESNLMMDSIDNEDEEDRNSTDRIGREIITKCKDGARNKKLRLTKEQASLLENSFKRHSTLTPNQKYALATILNLNPRQVEVWFQNRRARTKFKQIEVDCEHLKKWCQSLGAENQRLKKELKELKSPSVNGASSPQLTCQNRETTMLMTLCASCERKANTNEKLSS